MTGCDHVLYNLSQTGDRYPQEIPSLIPLMFSTRNNKRVHFSTTDTVYTFTNAAKSAPAPTPRTSSRRRRASMPVPNPIRPLPPNLDGSDYTSDDSSSVYAMNMAPRSYADIPLHFLLAYSSQLPYIDFDVSRPPTTTAFMSAPLVMLEAATAPPISSLKIRCPNTPWTVFVTASQGPIVTVWDVLVAIYSTLRRSVTPEEYSALPSHEVTKHVNGAYRQRHSLIEDPERRWKEEQKGVKRVDFLQGMNRFMGITKVLDDHPGVWTLVVSH